MEISFNAIKNKMKLYTLIIVTHLLYFSVS